MGDRRRSAAFVALVVFVTVALVVPDATAVPPRICFPVAGPTSYVETFGAPRSGGRTHAGNDLFAARHTPVVAAVDGWLDYVKTDDGGLSGRAIGLIGADGWKYRYIHLNNDNPGTDDGRAPIGLGILPGLAPGQWVLAGQVIGWVGDSGNAETTPPHLHFEIRRPDGTPVTPYPHLRNAVACPQPLAVDVAVRPGGGAWVLTATGAVHAVGGAPHLGAPNWGWNIGRSIAAMPDGGGYVILDGWGGIHRYGSATALSPTVVYRPGVDAARAIDVAPRGDGYAVLWADGSVGRTGSVEQALPLDLDLSFGGPRWAGDRARAIEITEDGLGWVVLDVDGNLHGSGTGALGDLLVGTAGTGRPAQGIALDPLVLGARVLDGGGTFRATGVAPAGTRLPTALPQHPWAAFDARGDRGVAVRGDGLVVFW